MLLAPKNEWCPSNKKDRLFEDPLPSDFFFPCTCQYVFCFKPPDFHTWVMLSRADHLPLTFCTVHGKQCKTSQNHHVKRPSVLSKTKRQVKSSEEIYEKIQKSRPKFTGLSHVFSPCCDVKPQTRCSAEGRGAQPVGRQDPVLRQG